MVIGVCGLGYTGSGAVKNLLMEYDDVTYRDLGEFSICYYPDGLEDLDVHINNNCNRFLSSDIAIKRFQKMIDIHYGPKSKLYQATKGSIIEITNNYIESITNVQWKGYWDGDELLASDFERKITLRVAMGIHRRIKKYFHTSVYAYPKKNMFLAQNTEGFLDKSRNYVEEILISAGLNSTNKILLDQPFSGDVPLNSMKFYDNPKAIVVYRDPRDVYILARKVQMSSCSWIPQEDVTLYIKYMKMMYRNIGKNLSDSVLYIRFEDLIYKYEETVNKIELFLGISEHKKQGLYFNKNISVNNTNLFRKYPSEMANIALIEREMRDYLFDFELYCNTVEATKSVTF